MPEPRAFSLVGSEMKSGRLVQDGKDNDDYEGKAVKVSTVIQFTLVAQ